MVDGDGRLIPGSFCDTLYLEQAFEQDQAFFLKTVGSLNAAQMQYMLEEKPYTFSRDEDFFKLAQGTLDYAEVLLSTLAPHEILVERSFLDGFRQRQCLCSHHG